MYCIPLRGCACACVFLVGVLFSVCFSCLWVCLFHLLYVVLCAYFLQHIYFLCLALLCVCAGRLAGESVIAPRNGKTPTRRGVQRTAYRVLVLNSKRRQMKICNLLGAGLFLCLHCFRGIGGTVLNTSLEEEEELLRSDSVFLHKLVLKKTKMPINAKLPPVDLPVRALVAWFFLGAEK